MDPLINQPPEPHVPEQKVSTKKHIPTILTILGVVVLVGGIVAGAIMLRSRNKAPVGADANTNLITPEQLKYRDADNDGLSDYDELTTYYPAFFKVDTDEDGI